MQTALGILYPTQCASCRSFVEARDSLCGTCWSETPFLTGLVCDCCGVPLMGEEAGARALCDTCLETPRIWARGRAALEYRDNARRIVLGLKHGDRIDLARPASKWMAAAAQDLLTPDTCLVPVPLHWLRRVRRRYNQSVLLARGIAQITGMDHIPDALQRTRKTIPQDGMTPAQRHANLADAMRPNPRRASELRGRDVILVDDVMTSGATFTAAAAACRAAGVNTISVLALARVVKDF